MSIIEDFDRKASLYREFSDKLRVLFTELLSDKGLRVHSVATRPKSRESFERKLSKEIGKYSELVQVTDLCGARITTYIEDEVDSVAALAESEFEIDRPNSIDKRKSIDADQFGYVSVHYVLSLKKSRAELSEYRRFTGLKFELQIRSILQHAWAEIEHDLQYKSEQAVPKEVRRRFARLAGLLEVADAEFVGLRKQIQEYRERIASEINSTPNEVLVDRDSLRAFIVESPLVLALDAKIAAGSPFSNAIPGLDFPQRVFDRVGLKTIGAVHSALANTAGRVVGFAELFFQRLMRIPGVGRIEFWRGVSIGIFSQYLLVATGEPKETIVTTLTDFEIREGLQGILLESYAQLLKSEAAGDKIASPTKPNPS